MKEPPGSGGSFVEPGCKPDSVSGRRSCDRRPTTTIYLGPPLLDGLVRPTWD